MKYVQEANDFMKKSERILVIIYIISAVIGIPVGILVGAMFGISAGVGAGILTLISLMALTFIAHTIILMGIYEPMYQKGWRKDYGESDDDWCNKNNMPRF